MITVCPFFGVVAVIGHTGGRRPGARSIAHWLCLPTGFDCPLALIASVVEVIECRCEFYYWVAVPVLYIHGSASIFECQCHTVPDLHWPPLRLGVGARTTYSQYFDARRGSI